VSSTNATQGVKLYSHSEVHEATVISVDVTSDTMTVRYEKNGAVEPKSISALSAHWFVRKPLPIRGR